MCLCVRTHVLVAGNNNRLLQVQFPDKIVIYESASEDQNDLHYKVKVRDVNATCMICVS